MAFDAAKHVDTFQGSLLDCFGVSVECESWVEGDSKELEVFLSFKWNVIVSERPFFVKLDEPIAFVEDGVDCLACIQDCSPSVHPLVDLVEALLEETSDAGD